MLGVAGLKRPADFERIDALKLFGFLRMRDSFLVIDNGRSLVRILVIEDEEKTASFVERGLRERGFVVDVASDGEEGLHLALTGRHDLLVLDVMLPTRDGWSIISELRRAKASTPVLFLTARDSVPDRVKGFDLGADDYLVKPFAFSELMARMRSLLRRSRERQEDILEVSDLQIDVLRYKAVRGGTTLNLTAKEFLVLSQLARAAGEVVSRTEIIEQVWEMNFDSDTNVVEVMIRRLRAKVDDPFKQKLIHTIRGVGYVLKAE
jgi:two-component system, OmpR family, copper resistance phosphate regulon response regulator CusR